jgi:D-arabinose 1-dehydrogenase-like Zn-dependent alcohol dehydrogenase
MRVVQVREPNAPLELVERPMPEPGPREVRLKVEACGICHSDVFAVTGTFPGVRYPTAPGDQVAGRIDKLGSEVTTWQMSQRVGGPRISLAPWRAGASCFPRDASCASEVLWLRCD